MQFQNGKKESLAIAGPVNPISRVPCQMRTNVRLCLVHPGGRVGSAELDKLNYNHLRADIGYLRDIIDAARHQEREDWVCCRT